MMVKWHQTCHTNVRIPDEVAPDSVINITMAYKWYKPVQHKTQNITFIVILTLYDFSVLKVLLGPCLDDPLHSTQGLILSLTLPTIRIIFKDATLPSFSGIPFFSPLANINMTDKSYSMLLNYYWA